MARRYRQLIRLNRLAAFAAVFLILPVLRTACAAPTASPTPATPAPLATPPPPMPTPPVTAQVSPTAKPKPPKPDEWSEARRLFEQLSPDQQKKFLDNLDQWKAMPPEEQELFRDRELFRREKIAQEIQDSINKSGLRLDDDQREVYALRYTQERRKIEEALRKEMDQKRQVMVGDMLARLKLEFATSPATGSKSGGSPGGK
jgi:dsDNA-binding SOS-regulon protein